MNEQDLQEVRDMLARAWHAMGEDGSNDAEHASLEELADFVAQLYGIERTRES